jgi:Ca2+-binding EF-hand superfamily protein
MAQRADEIPNFWMAENLERGTFGATFGRHLKRSYLQGYMSRCLTADDVEAFREVLSTEDQIPVALATIDFRELIQKIESPKRFLFRQEVLRPFVLPDRLFDGTRFLQFVDEVYCVQRGLAVLISCGKSISQSIDLFQLDRFIRRYSKHLKNLEKANRHPEYLDFYCIFAIGIFKFFLFPDNRMSIDIRELAVSKPFGQFVQLDDVGIRNNPFEWKMVRRIYKEFQGLDESGEGLVSNDKLLRVTGMVSDYELSSAFVARYFESLGQFNGGISFAAFVPLIIALDNLSTPEAAAFFFRLLDLDEDGKVGPSDIAFFYKGIAATLGPDAPSDDVFLAQVFDVCQCECDGFTLEQLLEMDDHAKVLEKLIDPSAIDDL